MRISCRPLRPILIATPAIRSAIRTGAETADERIMSLSDRVTRTVWKEAEAGRVELYLYTSPELDALPIEVRTASALPIVLWDRVSPDEAHAQTEYALKLARGLGIAELEDGPMVAAAALALYGIAFMDKTVHPWISDVLSHERKPAVRLEMLRFRMALDFGRRM